MKTSLEFLVGLFCRGGSGFSCYQIFDTDLEVSKVGDWWGCKKLVSLINHGFATSIVDQCVEKKSLHGGA
jgi:hypothetical protein